MRTGLLAALALSLLAPAVPAGENTSQERTVVRVLTGDFVLPGKFRALRPIAEKAGVTLESADVTADPAPAGGWLAGADLVVLDTPRPNDRAQVEESIGDAVAASGAPVMTVGGGPPAAHRMARGTAAALASYYAAGGPENFRRFFDAARRLKAGEDLAALPPADRLPATGFYHPQAPHVFETLDAYLAWAGDHRPGDAGRIGLVIYPGMVSDLQTGFVDALVVRLEAEGLAPVVFWFDGEDERGLEKIAGPARLDALVNLTHMRNGRARSAEFGNLDIPILQTLSSRESERDWARAVSGVPAATTAVFLAGPEGWGMADPIVLTAVENGERVLMPAQADALAGKLRRLVELRRKPAADKHLALMFWNYPAGEKNLAASGLNVPTSVESITSALAGAGYDVAPLPEAEVIKAGQAMLGALYRKLPLEELLERGLAANLPVSDYERWLNSLSPAKRHAFSHAGEPGRHWAVRTVEGVPSFVIPRLLHGRLAIMPQMPRGGQPGAHYHDTAAPPDHLYMAAYLYLRETFGADAIVHLGTHGTQEWLPGKDRGLAAEDDPFLAVGDVPVFYPYIQDNVGEALQARRRGRAVTISHQTPPFAPSGLYDELRDIHHLVHEYGQLDEGSVRENTAQRIADAAIAAGMHADLGWQEDAVRADFDGFLAVLHDHLHELARTAMPLGLHTFGRPAAPEHRLTTVMQQLGQPFYEAVGADAGEVFVDDFARLRETAPFTMLERHLRGGADTDTADEPLKSLLARAETLEHRLAAPGEVEALLAGLAGRFVLPGSGGDPIRNPEVESGRNLYAFEPDRLPTRSAYDAGAEAFDQLVSAFRAEHGGAFPTKLAFSLWSSEAIRHLGVTEAQVLHALGLRPVWDEAGRVQALDIVPADELGRPRVDVVVQVTSVYRDQFDGFMRLLADAIERITALDGKDNPIATGTARVAALLEAKGVPADEAREQASLRIFSNAPGEYGTGMPHMALASTTWDDDSALAETFLDGTRFAYGARTWGQSPHAANLFAEQLRGAQAAIFARSSNLHGVLSTDHPFEFLGGLSLAIRHLDGKAPSLYVSDLRRTTPTTTTLENFLSAELRVRYLNPHWIEGMKAEGYAGTLEMLDAANNLFGWQVVDPSTVRADQWQAMFDTYVADSRNLDINAHFEVHNPTAQAQIMERMVEAIRKGYWDASEETRRALAQRWQELAADHSVDVGEAPTREFVAEMAAGFGLANASTPQNASISTSTPAASQPAAPETSESPAANASQPVRGAVLEKVQPPAAADEGRRLLVSLGAIFALIGFGAALQWRANSACA